MVLAKCYRLHSNNDYFLPVIRIKIGMLSINVSANEVVFKVVCLAGY